MFVESARAVRRRSRGNRGAAGTLVLKRLSGLFGRSAARGIAGRVEVCRSNRRRAYIIDSRDRNHNGDCG